MKIETRDTSASDLLKNFLFIPRFQRPYDWEKEQVEQFWTDTVVENKTSDYFIGAVVLYKGLDALGIVDGQQRITTTILALCAIRNALAKAGLDDLAAGLHGKIEKLDIDNKQRFVLATESSFPYLQDRILSREEPRIEQAPGAEEKKLQLAFDNISDHIKDALSSWPTQISQKNRTESILRTIRDRILGLKLITVELDNEDDAYLIF